MKIVILTTRQNFVWHSMQEIIPAIEQEWLAFSSEAQLINVDEPERFRGHGRELIEADRIVVTAFNIKMVEALLFIREKLSIDAPWIFYLHNLATIGCWPLFKWGLTKHLKKSDTFISTCQRDKALMESLFQGARVALVPFPFVDHKSEGISQEFWIDDHQVKKIVWVGRISNQKNLHTLILSLSLLKKTNWELHLFGQEDHLGSPNMGQSSTDYLTELKTWSSELGVAPKLVFHGHQKRDVLASFLAKETYLFVSPSLHSDENFGMAALAALCDGAQTLLSDWGGHADFATHFPEQVEYINVYQSEYGPFLCPNELAEKIERSLEDLKKYSAQIPKYYRPEVAFESFTSIVQNEATSEPLKESQIARETWMALRGETQIFGSYRDPRAHYYLSAYAGGVRERENCDEKVLRAVPWVEGLQVRDPHRGFFHLKNEAELWSAGLAYEVKD